MKNITFNNGVTIPALGFGTASIGDWQQDDDYVVDVIGRAIQAGYRHFDTASLYGNERSVGRAIKASGIPREEFFVVTKVWDNEQGYDETLAAFNRSLSRLDMAYVDLYLVHWPVPSQTESTWKAMEELYDQQKVRALGLSNFRQSDIEQLLGFANVKPVYNQLELHPYLTQKELGKFCEDNDIVVSCWSPLGTGTWSGVDVSEKPVSDDVIVALAEKYGVNTGQIILKWDLQQGRIAIPKAESENNIVRNISLFDFELTDDELKNIDELNQNRRFGADPDTAYEANMALGVPA